MTYRSNLVLVIAICVMAIGCNRGPELAGVEGKVTLNGKPLVDLEVQFVPDPEQGTEGRPSSAYTDAEGNYRISLGSDTGVVVGTHRVCINDTTLHLAGGNMPVNDEGIIDGSGLEASRGPQRARRARIPAIYSDITQTPYRTIQIVSGPMQTVNFELTSKP